MYENQFGVDTIRPTYKEKPSNTNVDHVEGKDNDKTPHPRGSHVSQEAINLSDNEEPYITPFQKKIRREATPPPDDMDLEDTNSEVEQKLREMKKNLKPKKNCGKDFKRQGQMILLLITGCVD